MRLQSITVRNYRIHREQRVEFDPSRTVIGGPNESGKSTLIEAAHRALFLKAKTGGALQKSMVSDHHQGHPEVEVRFVANGKDYHLAKRFSGASGTATLAETGGESLHGDEAESKLAALLGLEDLVGGRGAANRLNDHWAHLWVWQGQAGENPGSHASGQKDALLSRLQDQGGAAVMQSEVDQVVADRFAGLAAELFNRNGSPKANTPLSRAIAELERATAERDRIQLVVATLRGAVDDLHSAASTISLNREALQGLQEQAHQTGRALQKAADLQTRALNESHALQTAERIHRSAQAAEEEIANLRQQVAAHEKILKPGREQEAHLQQREATARERLKEAAKKVQKNDQLQREAQRRVDLARAHAALRNQTSANEELAKQTAEITSHREDLAKQEVLLAELPAISAEQEQALRGLAAKVTESEAALNAMAAGIELLEASEEVEIGGSPLPVGELRVIDSSTEVTVGGTTRMRIGPGGGMSLAEARTRAGTVRRTYQEALDELGVRSPEEAAGILAKRQQLEGRLRELRTGLSMLGSDQLESRQTSAAADLKQAEAEVARRREALEEFPVPTDLESARTLLTSEEAALDSLITRTATAHTNWDAAGELAEKASRELTSHRSELEGTQHELAGLRARLQAYLQEHGEDSSRREALKERESTRQSASERLAHTRKDIELLNPEQLESDRDRLQRAIEQSRANQTEAEKRAAIARSTLERDGSTDPEADLELARADLESARDRQASIANHARAIQLLADLFAEDQQSLADQFTRPLAGRISGYLERLFGPGTEARVTLADGRFEGLQLTRDGHTFRFDSLSGGAREQLAAAFRLAIAEILAEDHGGCLPILFDDAFTNSDPDRVQALQAMLDLAATRGLQVIVLTCTPTDYAALGAATVTLESPG